MHNLRSALGKGEESEEVSLSRLGASRLYNKSKSGMWALEAELEEEGGRERGQAEARLRNNFEAIVQAVFKSDPNFSEVVTPPPRCASTKLSTNSPPNPRACSNWSVCSPSKAPPELSQLPRKKEKSDSGVQSTLLSLRHCPPGVSGSTHPQTA